MAVIPMPRRRNTVMENELLINYLRRELAIDSAEAFSLEELTERLVNYINWLIQNDFQKLVNLLYKVDIQENKLRSVLRSNPGENAAELIAQLMIERQMQKIKTRQDYKPKDRGPAEDKGTDEW